MAELCPWFAVRTRSRAEQTIANRLAAQGIDVFLPRYLEPVQWSDRLNQTWRPLFPSYLFARLDCAAAAATARTAGVIQILAGDVDPAQIDSLRIACQARANFTPATYRPGEMVRITSGPFAGCEGIVDRLSPNRLTLKIDLLKRAVSVEIDRKTGIERVRSGAERR